MFALIFALLSLTPAPNGTRCTIDNQQMEVIGVVKEPFNFIVPVCIYDTSVYNPKEVGWVWKHTFLDYGVKHFNVCRSKDNQIYLCPPYSVWMWKRSDSW